MGKSSYGAKAEDLNTRFAGQIGSRLSTDTAEGLLGNPVAAGAALATGTHACPCGRRDWAFVHRRSACSSQPPGRGIVIDGLEELRQRGIVGEQDAGCYDFSHDRIRDVAYAGISPIQRRLFHRRVAEALERSPADDLIPLAGELGAHYEQGGLFKDAVRCYRLAAGVAKQLHTHAGVVEYLQKALAVVRSLDGRTGSAEQEIDLLLELGLAQILTDGWGSQPVGDSWRQAYELAMLAGSTFQQCRALLALDTYHNNRGEWRRARAFGERNLELVQGVTDVFLTQEVLADIGGAVYHSGEPARALDYSSNCCHSRTAPANLALSGSMMMSQTNGLLRSAKCLWMLGFADQARARINRAVEIAGKTSDLFTLTAALGVHPPAMARAHLGKTEQKSLPILVVLENHLATVATRHQVVDRTGILVSQHSWHRSIWRKPGTGDKSFVEMRNLTPFTSAPRRAPASRGSRTPWQDGTEIPSRSSSSSKTTLPPSPRAIRW